MMKLARSEQFPVQGSYLEKRVQVRFGRAAPDFPGKIVRDDSQEPYLTIIALDDGRCVLASECQYQLDDTPAVSPGRREQIAKTLYDQFCKRAQARDSVLGEGPRSAYGYDAWEALPMSFKRSFYADADAVLALTGA